MLKEPETKESKISRYFWISIALSALCFKIFLIYYTYWHRHYLVSPGGDVIAHYSLIERILQQGVFLKTSYPIGFHLIVIGMSKLFHLSVWSILTNWTPVLIILPSLAVFFLLRQLFSLRVSVIATAILLLTSNYPLVAFIDSSFPDMLAYGVFAVMLFAFLIRYLKTRKLINLIWSGLFFVLIGVTHHFTFFNIFAILNIFFLIQVYQKIIKSDFKFINKIFIIIGIIALISSIGYLLSAKLYGGAGMPFLVSLLTNKPTAYSVSYSWNILPQYIDYSDMAGNLVWFFGLAGFLYLLLIKSPQREDNKVKQLIIIWFLYFYLISRVGASNFPPRFARELALPLTVLVAYLFEYLIEKNINRYRLGQILAFGVIGYLIVINSSLYTGPGQIPYGLGSHVFYWQVDKDKVDWMSENIPKQAPILYNPWGNWFFPVKATNTILPLSLSVEQTGIVNQYLNNPKNHLAQAKYNELIDQLKSQYLNVDYIFDDVQVSNMDPSWYHDYLPDKKVLHDLAINYQKFQVIKTFEDGSTIYKSIQIK